MYLTEQEIETILQEVIDKFLIPKFDDLEMNASGEWKENIEVRGQSIWGRKYTEQLVYGRRPGTFAPIAPLKQWAMIKLGLNEQQATSAAFAISHSMKEKGTTWHQKGGSDLLEILQSQDVIDFINEKTGFYIKERIILEVNRQLKTIK